MSTTNNNSTFIIKSSENSSFGTGFVVYKDDNVSYIVTCAHVIDACKKDSLLVNGEVATLVAIGAKNEIDLAVIRVEKLESTALKLSAIPVYEKMPFAVQGFKKYINRNHKFELLEGTIKKSSQIKTDEATIDIHELSLCLDDSIEQGYSGSAIYSTSSRYVFAVAISRYDKKHADAISIKYLRDIWEQMPPDLLIESSVLDEEEADLHLLKQVVNEIFDNNIEVFQRIVYSVLPKNHNEILPDDINQIIDMVAKSKDSHNSRNIPILCLAKILNEKIQNQNLEAWIEHKKNMELLSGETLVCLSNKLDKSYNILIEIIVKNAELNNANILVWEDKIFKQGEISYQNVIEEESINLKNSDEIAKFLDKLMLFLQKFSNPNDVLLEFILPKVLLKEDIHFWKTSVGNSISSKYRLVYRFHERVENYRDHYQDWIANWKETNNSTNKVKKLGSIGSILKSEQETERINRTTKVIITKFPIDETDIFPAIYEYGASILVAPSSSLSEKKVPEFNSWFGKEFSDVKVEDMVVKINDFCVNNPNDFKSKMILIWDDPHRVPSIYKNVKKPVTPKGFEGFGF
ncbi:MAG: Unknown protein [uncultured Sulfurovum sp.]|uniref:vWA-MoxR associated protein C-terminal domain-containing protein n=1 Tax=uncultured Sulfurovum sp. TaxID=269237 RepID=A0A6S6TN40_9BACT|nr:MAG: Unknown protein [uncultured Sulfurovum sp.]